MKKLLWISPYAPYDTVAHAGGKVHNYYLKGFHKSGAFDITLLSLCLKEEEPSLDLQKYGIKNHIFVMDQTKLRRFQRRAVSAWSYVNPYDRYAGVCLDYERGKILKALKEYISEGNVPDIVILQWTFSVLLTSRIHKIFPKSRIVAVEEDVTFLGYERKWKNAQSVYRRWFWKQRYRQIRKIELSMLQEDDLVVTNNPKDTCLLEKNGIPKEKIFTAVPFFQNYSGVKRNPRGRNVLFFGAMSREENYLSALWFIDHVMPLLEKEDIRFLVIGSNPNAVLLKRKSLRVKILGYVEDVVPYFKEGLCLAAPLIYGAGIKIKILEAMSAGVPVLTNSIGIEGINAVNGRDYLHCESEMEYADTIRKGLNGTINFEQISENARTYISENYNIEKKLEEFINILRI